MSDNDGVTFREGMDGYALVDKAQFEWLRREVNRLKYFLEDYKRDAKCYETAFDEAEADVKQSVQKQMAELRAENARLKRELSNANREFDRVTGWGYSVLAAQPALMDVTATLP